MFTNMTDAVIEITGATLVSINITFVSTTARRGRRSASAIVISDTIFSIATNDFDTAEATLSDAVTSEASNVVAAANNTLISNTAIASVSATTLSVDGVNVTTTTAPTTTGTTTTRATGSEGPTSSPPPTTITPTTAPTPTTAVPGTLQHFYLVVTIKTSIKWDQQLLDRSSTAYMRAKIEVENALNKSPAFAEGQLGFNATVRVETFNLIFQGDIRSSHSSAEILEATWLKSATFVDVQISGDAIIDGREILEETLLSATKIATKEKNVLESGFTKIAERAIITSSSAALFPTIAVILVSIIAVFC